MENNAITPQAITEIAKMEPEEIATMSENVIQATNMGNKTIDELDHLSQCLSDFTETHERYQKISKIVKDKMRYIGSHL